LYPDITQAIQDITSIKPRQKILAKKVLKKKELTPKDVIESIQDERSGGADGEAEDEETRGTPSVEVQEERVKRKQGAQHILRYCRLLQMSEWNTEEPVDGITAAGGPPSPVFSHTDWTVNTVF